MSTSSVPHMTQGYRFVSTEYFICASYDSGLQVRYRRDRV